MKKSLLTMTALLFSTITASADSIVVGLWDEANPAAGIVPLLSSPDGSLALRTYVGGSPPNLGNNFAGNITTLTLAPNSAGSVFREGAFDDVFNTGVADTIRLFYNFSGVTVPSTNLTFPAIFQASEFFPPGFTIAEQIFVCANGRTFCDNNITGGGTLIGNTTWTSLGTLRTQFDAMAPGTTFNIDLVFTIASMGGAPPLGDVGGAILTQPDVNAPVPGPVAGAGLPGLLGLFSLFGFRCWRRRR